MVDRYLQNSNPAGSTSPQTQRSRVKLTRLNACNFCRLKKVRCNDTDPCAYCLDHGEECVRSQKRRRRGVDLETERSGRAQRMAYGTTSIQVPNPAHRNTSTTSLAVAGYGFSRHMKPVQQPSSSMINSPPESILEAHSLEASTDSHPMRHDDFDLQGTTIGADLSTEEPEHPKDGHAEPAYSLSSQPPDAVHSPDEMREVGSISSSVFSNWEYHGPRSYLSICSKSGIQWVVQKTGSCTFHKIASDFTSEITRRLKIERKLSRNPTPEPDTDHAWRYTKAYFEEAPHAAFGIVHRHWFEARLKAHMEGSGDDDSDSSWYAIRNIIYASGCRIELSKQKSFREANQIAWGWFENALSVHSEILYFRTSLLAVQALTLMAYFTENIGSPCLEYMLCSNAMRLAVSKGLHRQPVAAWGLTQHELCHWNWLFWALYCLEKHIVSQSGRPSMIDDDDINCQVPTTAPPQSSMNVFYCRTLIALAQSSSNVAKKLSSVQAFRQGPERLVEIVSELDEQLNDLKRSLHPSLCLGSTWDPLNLPEGMSLQQVVYIQYAYYGVLFDIHTALTCPWTQSILDLTQQPALRHQVERSNHIVAQSCRDAILATKYINLDASTPLLLTFFGPMYALFNLFIYILQNPNHPNVRSDVAIMDICAGHFARLEFATDSEISIPLVRELAALARDVVRKGGPDSLRNSTKTSVSSTKDLRLPPFPSEMPDAMIPDSPLEDTTTSNYDKDIFGDGSFDLDLGNWSTLLPISDLENDFFNDRF